MSHHKKRPNAFCLAAVLLACLIFFSPLLPVSAQASASDEPQAQPADPTDVRQFVTEHLQAWENFIIVNEYAFLDTDVLQIYFMIDAIDDPALDFASFSDAFSSLLESEALTHDLVLLDLVDNTGKRLESYEIVPGTDGVAKGIFEEQADEENRLEHNQPAVPEPPSAWQERALVADFLFADTVVLQFYVMLPDDVEIERMTDEYLEPYLMLLDAGVLTHHDRVFFDILDTSGERMVAFDFDLAGKHWSKTEFVRDGEQADGIETATSRETISLPGADYNIISFMLQADGSGEYLVITFDFTNRSDSPASALDLLVPEAIQNDRALALDEQAVNFASHTGKKADPGETVEGCVLAYLLEGRDRVQIVWADPTGRSGVSFELNIDGR